MNHLSVSAQTEDNITYKEDIPVLYRREAEGGLTIHSNGFGLNFKKGLAQDRLQERHA
ncbi:MAG: hypothetical protein IPN61_03435 [Bacteroidetes bacterium]|nr:hypothetical protein [Bacteroidota bacterium]